VRYIFCLIAAIQGKMEKEARVYICKGKLTRKKLEEKVKLLKGLIVKMTHLIKKIKIKMKKRKKSIYIAQLVLKILLGLRRETRSGFKRVKIN